MSRRSSGAARRPSACTSRTRIGGSGRCWRNAMGDFRDRFDPLDDLEPPEVLGAGRGRMPGGRPKPVVPAARRVLVIVVAMVVAVAGIGFLFRARGSPGAIPATSG